MISSALSLGLAEVPAHLAGLASGVINNVQQLAGTVGIACVGAVYFTQLDSPTTAITDPTGAFRVVAWCSVGLSTGARPVADRSGAGDGGAA